MSVHRGLLLGTFLALAMGTSAQAGIITGSVPLTGINVTEDDVDLSVSTTISTDFSVTTGFGVGDLAGIPVLTQFSSGTIDLTLAGTGFGYSLSNPDWGTFTATSGAIVQQSSNFLDLFMQGVFVPGTELAGFDPTPANVRISVNQSGSSLSQAITLNAVPEPSSLVLLGIGATVGFVGVARRRWKRV